jgi:hypothetical protein
MEKNSNKIYQDLFNKLSDLSTSKNTLKMMIKSKQLDFLSDDLCLWLFDAYLKHSQHDKAMLILGYRTSIMNISSFFFSVGGVIESKDKGFMNFVKIQMQNNLSAIDYPLKHNWINLLTNRIND